MGDFVRKGLFAIVATALAFPPGVPAASAAVSHHSRATQSIAIGARGKIARSETAKNAFKRMNPCPSTGRPRGACPGYVIDHVIPLCAGGPDRPSNMQWQTLVDAKAKDREERRECYASNGLPE